MPSATFGNLRPGNRFPTRGDLMPHLKIGHIQTEREVCGLRREAAEPGLTFRTVQFVGPKKNDGNHRQMVM